MKRTIFSIRRHEEKDGDELTEQGKANAVEIGRNLRDLQKVYCSPKNRAIETAAGIVEGFGAERWEVALLLDELTPEMPEGIEDRDQIIDYWLENAYLVDGQKGNLYIAGENVIRHLVWIHNAHSNGGIVEDITHAPNIESALITMVDPRMRMEDIGGSFDTGEHFTVSVDYERGDVAAVSVGYRNENKQISWEKLLEVLK